MCCKQFILFNLFYSEVVPQSSLVFSNTVIWRGQGSYFFRITFNLGLPVISSKLDSDYELLASIKQKWKNSCFKTTCCPSRCGVVLPWTQRSQVRSPVEARIGSKRPMFLSHVNVSLFSSLLFSSLSLSQSDEKKMPSSEGLKTNKRNPTC